MASNPVGEWGRDARKGKMISTEERYDKKRIGENHEQATYSRNWIYRQDGRASR